MPTDVKGARDDVMTMLVAGLTAAALANLIPGVPALVWDDQTGMIDPPETANTPSPIGQSPTWLRAKMRHVSSRQASLRSPQTRYTSKGLLIFGVNAPLGDGQKQADALAAVILNIYRGNASPNGVWFRNGTPKEIGIIGQWWLTNVIFEFEYDTIV